MIVVDTNILAHFWLPSDSTELCDELYQKDPQWVAPILWRSEFRNVLTLYLRKELIDLAEAMLIMEKAELQMKDQQFQVNSVQVLHHVSKSTCSSYDSEFISLAKDLDLDLITVDKQLLREFPELAKHPEKSAQFVNSGQVPNRRFNQTGLALSCRFCFLRTNR